MQRRPCSSAGLGARCHLGSRDRLAVTLDFDVPGPIRISHSGYLRGLIACTCKGQAETTPNPLRLDPVGPDAQPLHRHRSPNPTPPVTHAETAPATQIPVAGGQPT